MKRFIEIIKYSWKAKGRHGIHSPFVYDLVANCFHIRLKMNHSRCWTQKNDFHSSGTKLICQLIKHFHFNQMVTNFEQKDTLSQLLLAEGLTIKLFDLSDFIQMENQKIELIFIQLEPKANCFPRELEHIWPILTNESIVVINGIRENKSILNSWIAMTRNPRFHFSADLLSIGILSKRPFQEKEHFVLRY